MDNKYRTLENSLKMVYRGQVTYVWPNSYVCSVTTSSGVRYDSIPFGQAGRFASATNSYIPEVGTPVLLIKSGNSVEVLKFMPAKGRGEPPYPNPAFTTINYNSESSNNTNNRYIYQCGQPLGLLQGDYVVGNHEGSYVAVLRGGLLALGSSPTASIYTFSTDDLVRLVSRNYQHYTDGSITQITNDEGEVNTEYYHSTMFFETLGEDAEGNSIAEDDDNPDTMLKRCIKFDKMPKPRLHQFTGWLGDVMHMFVTRRPDTDERLDSTPPIGVAEIFVGTDGAVRVRSTREITLEKVAKIRVPKKIREPWMNEIGDSHDKEYSPSPHEFYEWDEENGAGRSLQHVEHRTQQIDHEEVRHFKDHEKDWNVRSEESAELPEPAKDLYEGSAEEEYYETTAVVSMRNDGSLYLEDSWGSSVELTHEDLVLSARRDIKLIAGRDLVALSGRDITQRATKHFDMVAHNEDIRIKANNDLLLFSDKGTAALDSGIGGKTVINSREGKLLLRSEKAELVLHSDLEDIELISASSSIKLRAEEDIDVLSDEGEITIFGYEKVGIVSPVNVFAAVGPIGDEPDMEVEDRECNGKSNAPELTDNGHSASITPEVYLNLTTEMYSLDCPGDPRICKYSGTFALNDQDTDDKNVKDPCCGDDCCTVPHSNRYIPSRIQKGDHIWTLPGNPVLPDNPEIEGPDIEEHKEDLIKGRFRWRDDPREDITIYELAWNHKGDHQSIEYGTEKWSDLIPYDEQDVPDIGMKRPIVDDSQECDEDDKNEQVSPYSKYKLYVEGSMSWEDGVEPGEFESSDTLRIPDGDYSNAEENYPRGRLALYPGGEGETNPEPESPDESDVQEYPVPKKENK